MTTMISGWDIGGAHIKVARCDQDGQLLQVIQVACPLWHGIDQLETAIESIFAQLDNKDDIAAITMTGELVDIFTDRRWIDVSVNNLCMGSKISNLTCYTIIKS